jgi:hypothetical protein
MNLILNLRRICWSMPVSAPLRIRRVLCKVYEYGGIHSGTSVCSVMWFTLFTALFTQDFALLRSTFVDLNNYLYAPPHHLQSHHHCVSEITMVSHNTFENFHRLGVWFSLALFGVQSLLFTHTQSPSSLDRTVIKFLAFWFLLMSIILAILP